MSIEIVVLPTGTQIDGTGPGWNGGQCCVQIMSSDTDYLDSIDDVAYFEDMVSIVTTSIPNFFE